MNSVLKNEQSTIGLDDAPSETPGQHSRVIKVEATSGNDKIITLEIPLKDGSVVHATGTFADIVYLRKQLELEGKVNPISNHDELTKKTLQEAQDMMRRGYGPTTQNYIRDFVREREYAEKEKARRKKLLEDTMNAIQQGKAYMIQSTHQTKKKILDILIIGDQVLDGLSKPKNREKAGKTLLQFTDQTINATFPGMLDSLPHMREQVLMTSQQIMQMFTNRIKKAKKEKIQDDSTIPQKKAS